MEDQRIKEILIEKKEEFKDIYLKHLEYEQKLIDINNFREDSNDQDPNEEQNLKKRKLLLKDKMQKFINDYREQNT